MDVAIRPYRADDAAVLAAAARESTAEMLPWMPWCHAAFSEAEAQAWIDLQLAAWAERTAFEHCIVDADGRYLGGCGLNQIHRGHRFANLGYWVRTGATGRGVATSAVGRLVEFALRETDLIRLEIVVAVGNAASVRVAAKAGARLEGLLHSRLLLHGAAHDAQMLSLILPR